MADLRARFAALDALPAPDLWAEVERRAAAEAMGTVERPTGARPTWRGARPTDGPSAAQRRLVLVLVLLGLFVIALVGAVLVGSLLRDPPRAVVTLQPIQIEDFSAVVSIPDTWQAVPVDCCPDYREYTGSEPEGHLSVNHESPYAATVCSPECQSVDIPPAIPYSAPKQLEALKAGVASVAGSSDWIDLPPGILPEVVGGARLDTIATAADGREWHRTHVVGLRDRNVVAIAWSQPADAFDEELLDAVLAAMDLPSAPVYSDGDLIDALTGDAGFTMPLPGHWVFEEQPTLDDKPLSGVRRYGDGPVLVSIGDSEGTLGWCDPDCRELTGLTSIDALEAAVSEGRSLGPVSDTTLGGEPARMLGSTGPTDPRYVVAMHGDRPVALLIDPGEWDVAAGIVDEMIAGFRFVDPEPARIDQTLAMAGGLVELGLSDAWARSPGDDEMLVVGPQELTVVVGDSEGRIVTCVRPAGPWEQCREVQVQTLDELAEAVQPAPIDDHGVGPPSPRRDEGTLGGEPSVVTRIQAYEYPAQSGQEVVYVVAMHAGRPFIVRIWTSENEAVDVESVIAGFRFVD